MISRIVRSKLVLRRVTEVTSSIAKQRFAKSTSTIHRSPVLGGYVTNRAAYNANTLVDTLDLRFTNAHYCSKVPEAYTPELELNSVQFEKISTDTLESLTEYFDELVEKAGHLQEADVSYGDGVLTVKFGKQNGTYVINRQTPNKQIWLSSPKSGPKRYDFMDGKWIYKHDGKSLHDLLNREIPAIIRDQVSFEKCSYSGLEQYADRGLPNSMPD